MVRNCLICHVNVPNIWRNHGNLGEWSSLSREAFCLLFGVSMEQRNLLATEFSGLSFLQKLCDPCVEDLSNVHYVFWQLYNLERKLGQLQTLFFERLKTKYDRLQVPRENDSGQGTMEYEHDNMVKAIFEEINERKDQWPKGTYVSKWKETLRLQKVKSSLEDTINEGITNSNHDNLLLLDTWSPGENTAKDESDFDVEWKCNNSSSNTKSKNKKGSHMINTNEVHSDSDTKLLCTVDPFICNRTYTSLKDLNRHIREFHRDRKYICDVGGCPQKFLTEISLTYHKVRAHGIEKKRRQFVVCEFCGASIRTERIKNHFRKHHLGREGFTCDRCSMNFLQSEDLQNHEVLHDHCAGTFPFTCVVSGCDKVCSNSFDLKEHVVQEHCERAKCDICGALKLNDYLLKLHKKVHEKRTFVCEACPKTFTSKSSFNSHKLRIHKSRQFVCQTCGKNLSSLSSFGRHMRGHLEVKPYKCTLCPKTFASMERLKRHESVHSGTKEYECELCGKRFTQIDNLRQHLRSQAHRGHKTKLKLNDMKVKEEPSIFVLPD